MWSQALKRCFVSSTRSGFVAAKEQVSPYHLKPQPGLLAFAKNNESGIVVGVYSKKEIPRHQDFDIQIKVRGGVVSQVLHSSQYQVLTPNEDLEDDYLEMLSSAFPYSLLLPKVHPH
jgi:hypothetical protein